MSQVDKSGDRNSYLKTLMVDVQNGDRRAFEKLYNETCGLLFSVSHRLVQDRQIAEEIIQEAYILAWEKAVKFQHEKGTVVTWLATITRNLSIDYLRKKQLKTVPETEAMQIEADDPSPFQEAAGKETKQMLMKNVAKLPDNMKNAIMLSYYQGYSYDEIGMALNAPRNTVKSWIRRGIARLGDSMMVTADQVL